MNKQRFKKNSILKPINRAVAVLGDEDHAVRRGFNLTPIQRTQFKVPLLLFRQRNVYVTKRNLVQQGQIGENQMNIYYQSICSKFFRDFLLKKVY